MVILRKTLMYYVDFFGGVIKKPDISFDISGV
jgi:hypothetical protein